MTQPLHCAAQEYDWGRLGYSSTVARMKEAQALAENNDEFNVDQNTPYAELWLGTHGNGMSHVTVDGKSQSLLEYVQENPSLHCGSSGDLPFLLKVLSVRKVLSIQAHPDKRLAEQLHADHPEVYKDPNHKPEMAIALSEKVRAMCGFRPIWGIRENLKRYPEFTTVLGHELTNRILEWKEGTESMQLLRETFHAYVTAPKDILTQQIKTMVGRLRKSSALDDLQLLILQLQEQFPYDCGIWAPLLLNVMELNTGEGLFIDANVPHAYISGEILECMACSDNVVRAGLTPKLKDVPTLVDMLSYETAKPGTTQGRDVDHSLRRYAPPVADFLVDVVDVPPGRAYELPPIDSPTILLTLQGDGSLKQGKVALDVSFGLSAFVSAHTSCTILAGPCGLRLTRACRNIEFHFHK